MSPSISAVFSVLPAVFLAAGLLSACNREPEPRRYREIVTRDENTSLQGNPRAAMDWVLPAHWTVQPEGDPLRLTGFWAPDPELARAGKADPKQVDVSIVQLAGDAGGLEANVTRWLGQIGLRAALAPEVIAAAEPVRAATGQRGVLVDFTGFLSGDLTQSKSIVGAIFEAGDHTVFVKAMGDKARLAKIKPQLRAFCESLSIGGPAESGKGAP